MNICRMKPEFVEPLSLALFEEWHDFAPWSSLDKIRAYYAQCLDGDNLPLAFAAVDNEGRLMGSADWSLMSLSAIRPVPALPETSDPVMLILDCSPASPAIRVVLPPA